MLIRKPAASLVLLSILPASAGAQAVTPRSLHVKVIPEVVGTFSEAMSTSFQAAPWTDLAFTTHPEIPAQLDVLNPHHIRVQVIDQSIPETAPNQWDFSALDRQLQPILSVGDHSPEIQLAQAPTYLYKSKTHFVSPAFIAGYAAYAAGMVRHYNAPGADGKVPSHPIHYWGILNEPNYFHISAAEYAALYNAAVPAMLAVDPTIKLIALELGGAPSDERLYLPVFAQQVKAQTDILGIHFYSTCNERDSDASVFATIPSFVRQIGYLQRQLPNTPVWVLENNVNADFVNDAGNSTCNPTQKFVEDLRGSSAFFAAWCATEFAQFARAGVRALYHWHYTGGVQYGELNTEDTPAHLQLSYWLDLWLGKLFPPEDSTEMLSIQNPDPARIEIFAARQPNGRITILFANHSVAHPTDNNGPGVARTILLDLGALGPYTKATQLTIDKGTDPLTGPMEETVTPARTIQLTLTGYGVTFLTLNH
jgi:hypothetical protein